MRAFHSINRLWQQQQEEQQVGDNTEKDKDSGIIDLNVNTSRQTNYYTSLMNGNETPTEATNGNTDGSASSTEEPGNDLEIRNASGDEDSDSMTLVPATHYFDTNKVYMNLRFSGFTEGQAEIVMRAMRAILSHNLEECKEDSISQSGSDNEAYLFEAACSELRTEVQKSRETQAAEYGSNLARLQRDVEIAIQELNESVTTMKSGIDIDINERKHMTRSEASLIDMKLQELNNRIAIDIVSDFKSEIEGLRWQTTRRGLLAVVFVAAAVLIGISVSKKEEKSAAEKARQYTTPGGVEFAVPMLTSAEDEINYLEEKRFEIESLNELGGAPKKSS